MIFFQVSKLSEDQKKRSSPKKEHFFPRIQVKTKKKRRKYLEQKWNNFFPKSGKDQNKQTKKGFHQKWNTFFPKFNWRPALRCTPKSHYWGGDADVDHNQIIWGNTVILLGGYIPPGFRHPCVQQALMLAVAC